MNMYYILSVFFTRVYHSDAHLRAGGLDFVCVKITLGNFKMQFPGGSTTKDPD